MSGGDGPAIRWRIRGATIALDRPVIAGILNVTPDSFSDGGRFLDPVAARDHAADMVAEGADLIDVGAESTRPGAEAVSAAEEWRRLEPVLSSVVRLGVPVSVDTVKGEVARRALDAGASIINDVSGLRGGRALAELAARTGAGLVLMHMRGTPRSMQDDTRYDDVVREVAAALASARGTAIDAGCEPDQVAVDPGIGFGKSLEGNLELIARLDELAASGAPVWIGPSRKSFLGTLLEVPPSERIEGTIAACVLALARGARVFRVHDVRAVRRALDVARAIERAGAAADERRPVGAREAAGTP